MIRKTIVQGFAILVVFFSIWFALSKIDFVSVFRLQEIQNSSENKVGDLIWDEISRTESVVENNSIREKLEALIDPICKNNNINSDSLKIHLVQKDEVNAFALPNNHLVVYTGLILKCQKQEALQGVLGHEIAHITHQHVMKKLSKEIGLSILLSATAGEKGGVLLKEILQTLTSSAYDRSLEKEADIVSVNYLLNAGINPEPFADFIYELAQEQTLSENLYWISSHPESKERAKYILEFLKGKSFEKKKTLSDKEWESYKKQIKADLR